MARASKYSGFFQFEDVFSVFMGNNSQTAAAARNTALDRVIVVGLGNGRFPLRIWEIGNMGPNVAPRIDCQFQLKCVSPGGMAQEKYDPNADDREAIHDL